MAFVEVEEIDAINIYWAGIQAMNRAVRGLGSTPQHLLIDARRLKEIEKELMEKKDEPNTERR